MAKCLESSEGAWQVHCQCHDLHHHRTFCSRAFQLGEHRWKFAVRTLFVSECRQRLRVIKEFQSAEESGTGEQLGDQLPKKGSMEAGGRWTEEGTHQKSGPGAEMTEERGELECYKVMVRRSSIGI